MVPEGVNLILTKALSLPPDLGEEPKSGPGPAEQAVVVFLVARIEQQAPAHYPPRFMITIPATTTTAAMTRRVPKDSPSTRVPISAAKMTLVSRIADT